VNRLQRYILRQLLGPFLFFLLVLTAVIWLTQSLRFVDLIVNQGLSAGYFLYLTMLLLPGLLAIILPISLFAAVLYSYQRLATDSEVIVMRSAGLSTLAIAWPAVLLSLLVAVAGYPLTLYLMPAGQRAFKDMRTSLSTNLSHVLVQEGRFNTIGNNLTVYVRARSGSGELYGILVHDSRNPGQPVTMMAESGALVRTQEGPRFVLVNGNRQEVDHGEGQLSLLQFDKYTLDLNQFISQSDRRWLKPGERYLHELLWPDGSADDLANRGALLAEAHDRLTSPLYGTAFVLIALVFTLSGEHSRRGRGMRVVSAVACVVLLRAVGLGFVGLSAKVPALSAMLYLNVGLAMAICTALLIRGPRRLPLPSLAREEG